MYNRTSLHNEITSAGDLQTSTALQRSQQPLLLFDDTLSPHARLLEGHPIVVGPEQALD